MYCPVRFSLGAVEGGVGLGGMSEGLFPETGVTCMLANVEGGCGAAFVNAGLFFGFGWLVTLMENVLICSMCQF